MVPYRYATLATSLSLALFASAQSITLVAPGNVPEPGTSFLVHRASYVAPDAGGAGVAFDFSDLIATGTRTYTWTTPDVSPNAGLFPTATLALIDGGPDTVFYRTVAQGLERVGETRTITALGDNFPAGYTDGGLEMPLPITYGDTWTDPIAGSFDLDGNAATRSGNITGTADAYGFLTVPDAPGPVEVLRLNYYVDETISTSISGFPLSIRHTRRVVAYVPLWGKAPLFRTVSDSLSALGTYQVDSYAEWLDSSAVGVEELTAGQLMMHLFPNPATEQVTLVFASAAPGSFVVQVVDARGAVVQHTQTTRRTVDLDLSQWEAGLYQVVLTHPNGQRSVRPLAVTR